MNTTNEALVITMEECGELVQSCSKIIRHGTHSEKGEKWLSSLTEEAGDVLAMIHILVEKGLLDHKELESRIAVKRKKLKKYSSIFEGENSDSRRK